MNKIIKLSKALLIGLFLFVLCYLISCYAQASFDLSKHHPASRVIVGIIGGIVSISVFLVEYYEIKNK